MNVINLGYFAEFRCNYLDRLLKKLKQALFIIASRLELLFTLIGGFVWNFLAFVRRRSVGRSQKCQIIHQ